MQQQCGSSSTIITQSRVRRVANGDDAVAGAWPWIASIQLNIFNGTHHKYISHLAGAACRRRSAFHRQNHEKRPQIF